MKKQYIIIFILLIAAVVAGSFSPGKLSSFVSSVNEAAGTSLPSPLPSPDPEVLKKEELCEEYKNLISAHMDKISGDVQWAFCVLGENITHTENSKKAPSASVIKIFIMEYAFDRIAKGVLKEDSMINGQTVKNLLEAMITVSDNSATNVFIDHFGFENLNSFFTEKGYGDTALERKMLDTSAMRQGKDNYTSAGDVLKFLDKLYKNKDVYPYSEMLGIMKRQKVKTKIQRNLPSGIIAANKTGELNNVENDVGIIFTEKGDFAIAFLLSNLNSTASARDAIATAAGDFCKKITEIH